MLPIFIAAFECAAKSEKEEAKHTTLRVIPGSGRNTQTRTADPLYVIQVL